MELASRLLLNSPRYCNFLPSIGLLISLEDGANIVVAAKTATPHAKLPGTIYTAAEEIEKVL